MEGAPLISWKPCTLYYLHRGGPQRLKESKLNLTEAARNKALAIRATSDIIVYSDASGHHSHLGAAVVALDKDLEVTEYRQIQVGPMD